MRASWDFNNNGDSTNSEMVNPVINGEEFHLVDTGPFPQRYSHNCGEGPALTSTSSRMYAFHRGTGRQIHINTYNGSSWSGWRGTGSGTLTSSPAAVAWTDRNGAARIDVFANGGEDMSGISTVFWQSSWDGGATFSPWTPIPGGGNLTAAPAVTAKEGTLYLFGRGTNGRLYSRTLVPVWNQQFGEYEYNWTSWAQRTTDWMNSAPAAANYRNDQVQVWYTRTDLHPYQVWWSDTTGSWAGPAQPGGSVGNIIGAMGLMQWNDRFEVYGRGTDQRTYYKWYSSSWSNWTLLSQLSAIKSGLASAYFGGHSHLIARAAGGNLVWSPPIYTAWQNLGGIAI
ncbi:MAG: hypothetical protein L0Y54_19615 [Sporichthyaceae bacterium]|nr:hypothetical protein [Sporichthyaceae bacterium]